MVIVSPLKESRTGEAMQDDEALTKARALLTRTPVFDGHNDLAWVIHKDPKARGDVRAYDLTRVHAEGDTDIPRLREGMVGAQFWSAYQPTGAPHPARTTLEQIDLVRRIEAAHPDVFLPARSAADFERARRAGKIASYIVVEGGVGLENALAPLRLWHAAGARMLIPCHNETLDWVDSATDAPRHGGFNAFGRAVIGEANRLGMIVDGAHVSHDGIRRLIDVSEAPILLSHSNAFSLCDHPRNAPDDVLRRLKANGGAVLATFVPGFVSQALRNWLKGSLDAHGKAPPVADPKARFAALEARQGPAPRVTLAEVVDQ
ncbi:MAG: dipeptidase, partial [Roseiarcus sp.]